MQRLALLVVLAITAALAPADPTVTPNAVNAGEAGLDPKAALTNAMKALNSANRVFAAKVTQVKQAGPTNSVPPGVTMTVMVKDVEMLLGEQPDDVALIYSTIPGRGLLPQAGQKVLVVAGAIPRQRQPQRTAPAQDPQSPLPMLVLAMCQATDENLAAVKKGITDVPPAQRAAAAEPTPPTAEEALAFLQALPPVWRNVGGKGVFISQWKEMTAADIRTMKAASPGGHVKQDTAAGSRGKHLPIESEHWRYFLAFEQLDDLVVDDMAGVEDVACQYLGQLKTLRKLLLRRTVVGDQGAKALRGLVNMMELRITRNEIIGDEAVTYLSELPKLELLSLDWCPKVTGANLSSLGKPKNLKVLMLGGCSLSDAALEQMKGLGIQTLDLRYPPGWAQVPTKLTITFGGLKALLADKSNLPDLQTFVLTGVPLTKQQVQTLQELRPRLKIVF